MLPHKSPFKLILGSGSPRRRELLEALGYEIEVRKPICNEDYPNTLSLYDIPVYLAKKKAEALLPYLKDDEVLLTADTIVALDNTVLGKSHNRQDAFNFLKQLSGKTHEVITGFAVHYRDKMICKSATTKVTFIEFSEEQIEFYIDRFKPFDKAGAYGIQEWIGLIGVYSVEGSFYNVVGLPTCMVQRSIEEIIK